MVNPDPDRICTSSFERSNLSLRKAAQIHDIDKRLLGEVATSLYATVTWYTWYNFGRVHQSLRVTPAMEAGIADHA